MAGILDVIWVLAVVVLMFGAAIFVHEFGHYWVALKRGLKVEEFAIGFGPILWSREKDGILYSIRWIPAGGFVKLPQMLTSEALEGKPKTEDEVEGNDPEGSGEEDEEEQEELPPVSPWSKILVAFAGPFMNIVFAFVIALILWVVGVLKPASTTTIGYVGSSEEGYADVRPGDKLAKIDGQEVSTWQKVTFAVIRHEGEKVPATFSRVSGGKTEIIETELSTGKGARRIKGLHLSTAEKLIIAKIETKGYLSEIGFKEGDEISKVNGHAVYGQHHFLQLLLADSMEKKILVSNDGQERTIDFLPTDDSSVKVMDVPKPMLGAWESFWISIGLKEEKPLPPTAAMEAGIEKDDLILEMNDERITSSRHLIDRIRENGEKTATLLVARGDKRLDLKVTPQMDTMTGQVRVGIALGDEAGIVFQPTQTVYQPVEPTPGPLVQMKEVWDMITLTVSALTRSSETGVGAKDLSGPVGIFGMLSIQVKTDYRLALSFLVLLNINLAILNLLPVPVLDGGHIVMSIIEKIRDKPISLRVQEYATTVFAVMLLSFMLYVTFFDIKERVPIFRELFNREATIQESPSE
ncbi:MAG: hypothetical protein CMO74_05140 [Verrucomicrobiales bacterium]|nr:hypothetical protein [Verrucomicrobiales bacterium]|tara:strand:- start:67570 stop:69309 length:1740 start_codon:yes stop_codon:yes gene_type:complete